MKMNHLDRAAMLASDLLERLEQHINERGEQPDNLVTFFRKKSEAETAYKIISHLVIGHPDHPKIKSTL